MDLENECSSLKSTQDDQLGPGKVSSPESDHENGTIRDNGTCAKEVENLEDNWPKDADSPPQPANSNPSESKSPGGVSPVTTKGFGLKKWRRIRRDFVKDSVATVGDTSKVLKRVLPSNANPNKTQHSGLDTNVGAVDGFTIRGSGSDSRNAVGSVFAAGTDSENSEDRSSKSSTAASIPKARYDLPAVIGNMREKNRAKGATGKSFGNSSSQRVMLGKGGKMESSKKARGERVQIEKENSYSSIESDSRSSNAFFMQGSNVSSNGKQTGRRSASYDEENSDEAHESEQQFSEEVQTGYSKENVGDVEDSQGDSAAEVSWGIKEENGENNGFPTNRDPLVDSILSLQSVQEALEKEVQKLGQIGKEPVVSLVKLMEGRDVSAAFTDLGTQDPSQSNQFGSEKTVQTTVSSLHAELSSLREDVKVLVTELDEARALLVAKESKVAELKATVDSRNSPKQGLGSAIELEEKKYREIEKEIESLFKQRIEAEIQYLAITRATHSLKAFAEKQATVLKEQEAVAEEQAQVVNKLGDVERKALNLKKEAEELEKYSGGILGMEEVLDTQRGVYKVTWCFCVQFILLVLVIWFFFLQFSPPNPGDVVPT